MRIGYLDCFSGVSGDMWVGALLDAGLALDDLREVVKSLQVPGVGIRSERVLRAGVAGTRFVVEVNGREPGRAILDPRPLTPAMRPASRAAAPLSPKSEAAGHVHRRLADIEAILRRARMPAAIESQCVSVFARIAEVEAQAHMSTVDAVHFHEVGAEDTIVDVVCACVGTKLLGVERLYSSAVAVGSGVVRAAHGVLPVPAPATMALLAGVPIRSGTLEGERTTPTGAALLAALVTEFEPRLAWVPGNAGYGAGTRDDPAVPNLLRLTLGEERNPGSAQCVEEITCQLDTATGEHVGWLVDEAMQRGALDAVVAAVQMKKGRPGFLVTVIADVASADRLATFLLEESGSLGVRRLRSERSVVERWQEKRDTVLGAVTFKCARLPSGHVVARAEDDDLRRLCRERGIGRAEVIRLLAGQ